jgi:hypothetical protein
VIMGGGGWMWDTTCHAAGACVSPGAPESDSDFHPLIPQALSPPLSPHPVPTIIGTAWMQLVVRDRA